jgi:iron complex outermembrane receptor protein
VLNPNPILGKINELSFCMLNNCYFLLYFTALFHSTLYFPSYHMKKILFFQVLLLLLLGSPLLAQQLTIKGTVKESGSAEPLAGVNIRIKNTTQGTTTAASGQYQLRAKAGDVLVFSYIGYQTQEVSVGSETTINVNLAPADRLMQDIQIVGSRNANRTELNTTVPVDVIDMASLQQIIPQYDVNQILTYLAPSFNANRQSASDGTEHIEPASLRGLGPDQTLVLINGKRRHTTSLLNNQGTFGNGTVGTDLNAIPAAAIERIEILRDGASAQYGSDAIAGVINIVLKKNTNLLNVNASSGVTSAGDGLVTQFNANYGIGIGKKGGYLNITGEYYHRGQTNRTNNHDLIIFDQSALGNFFAYAFTSDPAASRRFDDDELARRGLTRNDFNFRVGDAQVNNASLFLNFSLPLGNSQKTELYAFSGLNYRKGKGNGFRRLPSETSNVVAELFPLGFQPSTLSDIFDGSLAVGLKHRFDNGWLFDLSNTLGNNRFDYTVDNTNNASLRQASPTRFDAGGHAFLQNTINADLSRFYAGVLSGLNVAFGAEFRLENYKIRAGEEASWRNYAFVTSPDGVVTNPSGLAGGSQSFNGYAIPVNQSRNNVALYADAEMDITKKWTVEAAARFENYSDFGATLNGKVATRVNLTNAFALRGALSTGFRAPSLHQQFFTSVTTDILPNGRLGQSGFFANNSPIAAALGIPKLKHETSVNYSVGATLNPTGNFSLTVDGYMTRINDRVVLTGGFGQDPFGDDVPEIQRLLLPFGADVARFFTNAVSVQVQGIDAVAQYRTPIGSGKLDLTLAANFNRIEVGSELNIPSVLVGQEDIYFSPAERTLIERSNPRSKINAGIGYNIGKFGVLLRNTYFGEVTRNGFPFGDVQVHSGKLVTDLSFAYELLPAVSLTVGANNLFNVFPDEQIYPNSYFGVFKYAPVQMGMGGAFYFARLNFRLAKK